MSDLQADGDQSVAVIGGGTMGAGIAQVLLSVPDVESVHLVETDEVALAAAAKRVRLGLSKQHRKAEDPEALIGMAMNRLQPTVGIGFEDTIDLAIEAVPEDFSLKAKVLADVSVACPSALIASNTSSLSVSALARTIVGDTRFIGLHFFNPVPRSKLVEIVRPDGCEQPTIDLARDWVARLGKSSIEVGDSPGFATSRLGLVIALEAMRMVESGVATVEDIDRGMTLGYQFPIGPLELTDLIGLDVRLAIAEHLAATIGPRFEPPVLLRTKVAAGELGQKSGQGFYDWTERS